MTNKGMAEPLVSVRVGWGEPTEDGDFIFNFHISMGQTCWREMVDYNSLTALDVAFKASSPDFRNSHFPNLNRVESMFLSEAMEKTRFDAKTILKLESIRSAVEAWIINIVKNITRTSRDVRRLCQTLFFSSFEHSYKFDGWMREMGIQLGSLDSIEEETAQDNKNTNLILRLLNAHAASSTRTHSSPVLNRKNLHKAQKRKDYLRNNVAGTATMLSDTRSDNSKSMLYSFFATKARSAVSEEETKDPTGGDGRMSMSVRERLNTVLSVAVQRGMESAEGVHMFSVTLRVRTKDKAPVVFRTFQRYSKFRQLWRRLEEINDEITSKLAGSSAGGKISIDGDSSAAARTASTGSKASHYANFIRQIAAPFPASPVKSYLGISLSEANLDKRAELLDRWFRDVCFHYRDMPASAREAVRLFLNFDMKAANDIYVHDQLSWGTIEPNKVDSPVLIVRHSEVVKLYDSHHDLTGHDTAALTAGVLRPDQKVIRKNTKEVGQYGSWSAHSGDRDSLLTPRDSCGSRGSAGAGGASGGSGRGSGLTQADVRAMNGSILCSNRPNTKGSTGGAQ